MSPGHERFADLATRTLEAHPEIRGEARAELLGRLAHGGAEPGMVEAALPVLENAKPSRFRTRRIVLAALVVAMIGIAGHQAWRVKDEIRPLVSGWGLMRMGDYSVERELRGGLSDGQWDFVSAGTGGDHEVLRNLERQRSLHPDDPGLLEESAHRHLAMHGTLPAGFGDAWKRIDPGNGIWPYLEAMEATQAWKSAGFPPGTPVHDQILRLLEQSADAERFGSHLTDLRRRRFSLLGEGEDLRGETARMLFAISAFWLPTTRQSHEVLRQPFAVRAKELAAAKDGEGLRDLAGTWERLVGRLGVDSRTILELSVVASSLHQSGDALSAAARDLGLGDLEKRIDEVTAVRTELSKMYGRKPDPERMGFFARMMSGIQVPGMFDDPSVFEPGRRAEYAVAERWLAIAAALVVLAVVLGCGFERVRRGRRVNGVADGLAPFFTRADFAWIAGLGIVLPALWYLAITRFTPFGGRDLGFSAHVPPPGTIQAASALVFSLAVLVQAARWRIARRVGFLALKPAWAWVGWAAAGLAAGIVPLAGAVRWVPGDGKIFLHAVAAAGGLPLLWLLWRAGAVLFSPRDRALAGTLSARRLVAPLLLLAALPLVCLPGLKAVERHWHARDEISRCDPDHGGMIRSEARAVEWMRSLFREVLPEAAEGR